MRTKKMGNSDLEVSVLGMGTWPLGSDFFGTVDEETGIRAVRSAVEQGVTLIDTAPAYGEDCIAEKTVGKALEGIRDQVVISDKCGVFRKYGEYVRCLSPQVVRGQLEDSLRNLKTDYIDLYMIHWPDMNFGIDDALDLLQRFKEEGKIREAAVSNFDVEQIEKASEKAGIVCLQSQLSLLDRQIQKNGVTDACKKHGVGIMSYGALAGGLLSGAFTGPKEASGSDQRSNFYRYFQKETWEDVRKVLDVLAAIASERGVTVTEVAINWVLAQEGVSTVLFGSTSPEHIADNVRASAWEITPEEVARIDAVCDFIA